MRLVTWEPPSKNMPRLICSPFGLGAGVAAVAVAVDAGGTGAAVGTGATGAWAACVCAADDAPCFRLAAFMLFTSFSNAAISCRICSLSFFFCSSARLFRRSSMVMSSSSESVSVWCSCMVACVVVVDVWA